LSHCLCVTAPRRFTSLPITGGGVYFFKFYPNKQTNKINKVLYTQARKGVVMRTAEDSWHCDIEWTLKLTVTRGTVTHGWLNTRTRVLTHTPWPRYTPTQFVPHTHTYTHTHTHTHTHTRTLTHQHTHKHAHTHKRTKSLSHTHTITVTHTHQHPHANTNKLTYTTSHSKTPSSWHSFSQLDIRLYNITVRWSGVNNHSGRTVPKNDCNPLIELYRSQTWS